MTKRHVDDEEGPLRVTRRRAGGRVIATEIRPIEIVSAVVSALGGRPSATIEKRVLVKRGKPFASGYRMKR